MLSQFSTEQWILSFGFICTFTFVCGWIADRIMGYAGFGAYGNWIVLLTGTYLGMYGFNEFGHSFHWNPPLTIAATAGTASVLLLFPAIIKTIVSD